MNSGFMVKLKHGF